MTAMSSIGFIGLGAMGWPMAARLVAAGHKLIVEDASQERAQAFAADIGATAAETPTDVARGADILITMLPTSAIVAQVMGGDAGACAALRPGTIVIEMSSGIPAETQRIAEAVRQAGGSLIDAPVSGGVPRARTGELTIMAGGPLEIIDRVEPVLRCMGTSILRTGDIGSAHAMKALNNLASAAGLLATVEVLLIGKKFGLDPALMVDVLNVSTGMNNSTQKKLKQFILSRKFSSGFGLDLMVKDLTIATGLAEEMELEAPFSALCQKMWKSAAELCGPGHDHTEIARLSEKLAGLELG
ncbi:MAG TPA: NAD(P)-dependent oxidoreductase [Magnetospirillaceae bacterium]|jgi:3-hydroxyisobutyrate dehydrogenase